MNDLLVVGGASLDRLHLAEGVVETVGGAGLYTALAAARLGASVAMLAPRPEPCPTELQPLANRLTAWHGPPVTAADLPHFEIAYRAGHTEYHQSTYGAVPQLTPELLPSNLSAVSIVHVTPLGDPARQLALIRACRRQGARLVSAGTNFVFLERQAEVVRQVMAEADLFFLNEREATTLFGELTAAGTAPGKVLYITLGAKGVLVFQGAYATRLPTQAVIAVDPTGAGDCFCGATLAGLGQKLHPIMAAQQALPLVTASIAQVGPAALLADEPVAGPSLDRSVRLNESQLERVAAAIARFPGTLPHNFVTAALPPVHHPAALDYFFAATLQQFSFWYTEESRYAAPMWATLAGKRYKGSDYLWAAFWRRELAEPGFSAPQRQANLRRQMLEELMLDDAGHDPLPAASLHLTQAQAYGRDMGALALTPQRVIDEARSSARPLQTFLTRLDQVGGYKEDPLRKKSALLAKILNQRPEKFLPFGPAEDVSPVIDYHAMRACLRLGLVEIVDEVLDAKIKHREMVTPAEEWIVRLACFHAYESLVARSGKRYGAVGWFLFSSMRRYCLEMSEPLCTQCHLDSVCQHRRELFQPIMRTTFY